MSAGSTFGTLYYLFAVVFTVGVVWTFGATLGREHEDVLAPGASPEAPGEEDDGLGAEHPEPNYLAIFVALAVLTGVELAVPEVLGRGWAGPLVVLGVLALLKALLVALFFMHLRFEGSLIYSVCLVTVVLVLVAIGPIQWDIGIVYGTF